MNSATDPLFRFNTKNPDAVISIIDESLEMKTAIRCELFSSVSLSEVALALFDKKQNKFLALEVFQNDKENDDTWIQEIKEKSIILKKDTIKSVHVEIINELTTIVPAALFHEDDAATYFNFNFSDIGSTLKTERIPFFDAINIYSLPESLNKTMHQLFEHPNVHHHSTVLLQGINLYMKKFNEKMLLLNIRNGYVDIIVTEGKQLVFINAFQYKTIDDLAYFVMFVCDRLQLNPETISTGLMGQVERESAIFHLLTKYIRNIRFVSRPDFFEYSYVFEEIPAHFYFNLFSLALCES